MPGGSRMEEGQPSFEVRFQDLFGRLLREQIHWRQPDFFMVVKDTKNPVLGAA